VFDYGPWKKGRAMTRRIKVTLICLALCAAVVAWGQGALSAGAQSRPSQTSLKVNSIKHVVIIL
jgi:hypothetical protein